MSCSQKLRSELSGTFNNEKFDFKRSGHTMARNPLESSYFQGNTFEGAKPISHIISFGFSFGEPISYEMISALVGKNLLNTLEVDKEILKISVYDDGSMLDISRLSSTNEFIIEEVRTVPFCRDNDFPNTGKVMKLSGRLKLNYNENVIEGIYHFEMIEMFAENK